MELNIDRLEVLKWVVFLVLAIILVLFLIKMVNWITRAFTTDDKKQKELADDTPDAPMVDGEKPRGDFNPASYANDLHKVNTENHFVFINNRTRCNVYERVVTKLNDNELILVSNYYKNKFDRLLRNDLKDIVNSECSISDLWSDSWYLQLTKRLDKLPIV